MKSMPVKRYFEVIHPTYSYLKLIPDTSIRNYNSSNIAKMIADMYQKVSQRIKRIEKRYCFQSATRCSYFIDITKNSVDFYFVIPQQYENIAREKITATWPKITIEKVEGIKEFGGNKVAYQLNYKKEDALSLQVDTRSNALLNSVLNVVDILEEDDRIGIFYNFVPIAQKVWQSEYRDTLDKWKENKPLDRNKLDPLYIAQYGGILIVNFIQSILDGVVEVFGSKKDDNSIVDNLTNALNQTRLQLSESTKKKKDAIVINTQIAVLSSGNNLNRVKNNAIAVCQSFNVISEDNELVYKKAKIINLSEIIYLDTDKNKLSVNECHNLIQLPGRELLEKHNIEHINTLETQIPEELREGIMSIGSNTYKGSVQKAYLSSDFAFKFLTLCLIGPTRAGKTTLISNLCLDSSKVGEVNVIFDWCGNCELSQGVISSIGKLGIKVLVIDCGDPKKLQGLGYNELYCTTNDVFERYRSAKAQSSQLITLINSIQGEETDLKARMERYLEAAAVIVFLQNGPIRDVFNVLQRHQLREDYINKVPADQKENTEEYIESLRELNDVKNGEVIGTKLTPVQGILNRANKLKQNTYVEMMLKRDCSNNFNLTEEIQKAQAIFIKMPEHMFQTETEKDIYATYWITKLWSALQQRKWKVKEGDMLKVNMHFDELYQTPNCQEFLKSKLSQIAKFHAKPIISCHYLGQIPRIRGELKAANTSYMLISGCDKMNYSELKEELDPYTVEDLLHMKRYHSLNLIKTSDGYARFITQLPKPIN